MIPKSYFFAAVLCRKKFQDADVKRISNSGYCVEGNILALSVAVTVYLARGFPDSVSKLFRADIALFA